MRLQANSAKGESRNTTIKALVKMARGFRNLDNTIALIHLKSTVGVQITNYKSKNPQNIKVHSPNFKTLGFLFEGLCIRDLKAYSAALGGQVSHYRDRYGLEADAVLHLSDGRYALIEFKLGSHEIEDGARHLCIIERLVRDYNAKEQQVPLREPDLKLVVTGTEYGYRREDGGLVVPIGCLKQ